MKAFHPVGRGRGRTGSTLRRWYMHQPSHWYVLHFVMYVPLCVDRVEWPESFSLIFLFLPFKMHRRMLSLKPLSVSLFFCAVHLTQHESTATHPPCPPHPPLSLSSSSYFSTFISTETCHASKSNSGRGWLRTVPRCLLNYVWFG